MSEELKAQRLVSPVGRLAFSRNLFKQNEKGRYSVCVVFEKTEENMEALKPLNDLVEDLMEDKWGSKRPATLHKPMKIQEDDDMAAKYVFLADKVVLNASNGFEIGVVNAEGEELKESDLKAGDHVKISVSGYAYDNKMKGVGFNANAILKVKDGEAFYGRQNTAEMFGITAKPKQEKTNDFGF